MRLVVLFPDGRISEVQRRFMTTATDANVRCVAIDGTFDDCQSIVKAMFQAQGFRQAVDLSGVNSINWARIAAQVVYYFTAAVALGAPHRPVSFVVPTGNFGDAFAGFVARQMGLPIEKIVVATNGNDILARAIDDGRYARGAVVATQSPAMDIQVASNFERLYFEVRPARRAGDFAGHARLRRDRRHRPAATRPSADPRTVRRRRRQRGRDRRAIVSTLNQTGELVDPHTAVGLAAADRLGLRPRARAAGRAVHRPSAKFPEAVAAAAGVEPRLPRSAHGLAGKAERIDRLPADAEAVKAYIREFAQV